MLSPSVATAVESLVIYMPPSSKPTDLPRYSWRNIHPEALCHYVRDVLQANTLVGLLQGPVGLDLEWKPAFRKGQPENPVSLIQLANQDSILLIQVSAMQEFPAKLQAFLENPDFVKAGVGIQNDVKKLYRDYRVSTRSCVDLSLLARSVDNEQWKGKFSNPLGLARLVEAYENSYLPKGKIVRSDWESMLSSAQQEYACNDAHAGYVIYNKLMAMAQSMTITPKPVYYKFDAVRGRFCEPSGMYWAAFNPDYDPGPPAREIVRKEGESETPSSPVPLLDTRTSSGLSSNLLPHSDKHRIR